MPPGIREVGLIEPPVVARAAGQDGSFILLDGHVRLHVLKEMGEVSVTCLVATDDESFTYNKRISRLATIQEHKMILRAVERGVSEARIAAALNVNIALIRQKRTLLNGICHEAAELLKARHCPINSFRSIRKMKPLRQIQAAELMIAANNFTVPYVEAILAATDAADLVDPAAKRALAPAPVERHSRPAYLSGPPPPAIPRSHPPRVPDRPDYIPPPAGRCLSADQNRPSRKR